MIIAENAHRLGATYNCGERAQNSFSPFHFSGFGGVEQNAHPDVHLSVTIE